MSLELRQPVELLADRDLEVVPRDGLVERDRLGLGPRRPGGVGGVDEVGAGPAAVGRRREVVGVRGVGGEEVGDRFDPARRARQPAEPCGHRGRGGAPRCAGRSRAPRRRRCGAAPGRCAAGRRSWPGRRCRPPTARSPRTRRGDRPRRAGDPTRAVLTPGGRSWCAGGSSPRRARRRRAASTSRRARRRARPAPAGPPARPGTSRTPVGSARARARSPRRATPQPRSTPRAAGVPGTDRRRPLRRGSRPACAACAPARTPPGSARPRHRPGSGRAPGRAGAGPASSGSAQPRRVRVRGRSAAAPS